MGIEFIEGGLPVRKRKSDIQSTEAELAEALLKDLGTKPEGEPSDWAVHPVAYPADTARVVTSRINTGVRQELPGERFEATCIDGVIYVRARGVPKKLPKKKRTK